MINKLLKAYLNNLVLTATDGKVEWIGTASQWAKVKMVELEIAEVTNEANRLANNF